MSIIEAIILGIVQGLTEFLPVSSSGHIELGKAIMGLHLEEDLLVSVVLHAATALSTIIVFRNDILEILKDIFKFEWNESTRYSAKILLSMIPVGIVGLLYKDTIEQVFMGNVYLVSAMLVITGLLLLFTHLSKKTAGTEISYWQALIIGIAQSIAVIPGISRSGATIATAILIGVDKSKAAKFSFLMVLPPIIGMNLLALKDYLETDSDSTVEGLSLLIGFIAAFLTGLFACKIMIELVKKGKLLYFALYCFVIGLLGIILS